MVPVLHLEKIPEIILHTAYSQLISDVNKWDGFISVCPDNQLRGSRNFAAYMWNNLFPQNVTGAAYIR